MWAVNVAMLYRLKYLQERAKAAKNSAYFWHNKVKEDLDCSTCG